MNSKQNNYLRMRREVYHGVTATPHFPTSIVYEGCCLDFEDIYFDNADKLHLEIGILEQTRKGNVILNGGSRLCISLSCNEHGALVLSFHADPTPFPGRLILDGHIGLDGDQTLQVFESLQRLFVHGEEIIIEPVGVDNAATRRD